MYHFNRTATMRQLAVHAVLHKLLLLKFSTFKLSYIILMCLSTCFIAYYRFLKNSIFQNLVNILLAALFVIISKLIARLIYMKSGMNVSSCEGFQMH